MRLIDADAFKLYVQRCILIDEDLSTEQIERYLLSAIDSFTEIDAVPVVRCKDCKWFADNNNGDWFGCWLYNAIMANENDVPKADDFCSYGERRKE